MQEFCQKTPKKNKVINLRCFTCTQKRNLKFRFNFYLSFYNFGQKEVTSSPNQFHKHDSDWRHNASWLSSCYQGPLLKILLVHCPLVLL